MTEKDIDKDTSVILDTRGPACQPCSADPTGRGPALCQPAPGQEKQFWYSIRPSRSSIRLVVWLLEFIFLTFSQQHLGVCIKKARQIYCNNNLFL